MGGYYDELAKVQIVEKTLSFNGIEKPVYFRPLTAGERMAISRGQKISIGGTDGAAGVREVDAGDTIGRTHKFLSYCNVDASGAQVFRNEHEVGKLPEDLVNQLNILASQALEEIQAKSADLGKSS